jgi:hypothetical protein
LYTKEKLCRALQLPAGTGNLESLSSLFEARKKAEIFWLLELRNPAINIELGENLAQ